MKEKLQSPECVTLGKWLKPQFSSSVKQGNNFYLMGTSDNNFYLIVTSVSQFVQSTESSYW